jgi:PAS domain S-box-containing protein
MPSDATGGEVKFLLVDDLEENLYALEALLQRDGLRLYKARSGSEALELLLVHDFALALLDVQMDGMDGFELAELMRGTERTRRVPIIFLSAVATDERRHFRGYETGAVDFLFKPLNAQMLTSKAGVFFELARQRAELARQRDDLRQGADRLAGALARLRAHADNSPLAVIGFDADFHITDWSMGAERIFGWPQDAAIGRHAEEFGWLPHSEKPAFAAFRAELCGGEQRNLVALRLQTAAGSVVDCEWYASVLRTSSGAFVSMHAQILDVTERKRVEATQRLLLSELNHRVKNMLATVQAIATQTLHSANTPEDFVDDFSGRLQALARAHSLLSNSTWQGAMLRELVQEQLRLGTLDEARLEASGPDICLEPQLALHVGLILHELATNANKYGALTVPDGRLFLSWQVVDATLHLRWRERGGPRVQPPRRIGVRDHVDRAKCRRARRYGARGIRGRCDMGYRPGAAARRHGAGGRRSRPAGSDRIRRQVHRSAWPTDPGDRG